VLPKAVKNEVEISGHQAAQARDGAAVSRFLRWVEEEAPNGGLDEMIAAEKLLGFRQGPRRPQGFELRHHFGVRAQRRPAPL
jgi:Xaa-Pro aminopeptidase